MDGLLKARLYEKPRYNKLHVDDVKYRVVKYESWPSSIWAVLLFFFPPLRLLAPLGYDTHPGIEKAAQRNARVWQESTSQIILVLLLSMKLPLAFFGYVLEWFLNFYYVNNGFVGLISKLMAFDIEGIVFNPQGKDRSTFFSVIGWLDQRTDLIYPYSSKLKIDPNTGTFHFDSKIFADLCIMACKLAYESRYVQEPVVNKQWKMCFREFYDCQNAHEMPMGIIQNLIHESIILAEKVLGWLPLLGPLLRTLEELTALCPKTQAFTFTDKPRDADLVVLTFRGTEPFNADDWATDFDFSFVELDDRIGRLHVGFLEALGLVDRNHLKESAEKLKKHLNDPKEELTTGLSLPKLKSMASIGRRLRDLKEDNSYFTYQEMEKLELAQRVSIFEKINADLIQLLKENPKARLVVTGHSLGGALAAVFAGLLLYKNVERNEKKLLLESLSAIYTFGQPRVGDKVFASFMASKLEQHKVQYYRVVYAYDLVPRVPFDDRVFGFKHFGFCCYNNVLYQQKALIEQPNRNFVDLMFSAVMRLSAGVELLNGMVLNRMLYGDDFHDSHLMALSRFVALLTPGLVAHAPPNYINSIRLGPSRLRIVPFEDTL
ncbi:hypothetical protein GOP47_0029684 [Adiantum capillus-veneris]|nr:hypothetical protein GOP47_0029373 [Adiantum capillus-veneris]KAI5056163.1 hypothetical protein GOP47_0029684 [Adiantum capillus-veneris]